MSIWDDKAMQLSIDPRGKPMFEVIREVQIKEGYTPCYGTRVFKCSEMGCLWRQNCQGRVRLFEVE